MISRWFQYFAFIYVTLKNIAVILVALNQNTLKTLQINCSFRYVGTFANIKMTTGLNIELFGPLNGKLLTRPRRYDYEMASFLICLKRPIALVCFTPYNDFWSSKIWREILSGISNKVLCFSKSRVTGKGSLINIAGPYSESKSGVKL